MPASPGGRSVGRVNIRVVPDSTLFRRDLLAKLAIIEKNVHFTVNVDKANVNRQAIKDDIQRQMAMMRDIAISAKVAVTVDRVNLDRKEVQRDLIAKFKAMRKIDVNVRAKAIVTDAEVRKVEVRASLQRQFDEMGLKVKVGVDLTKARHDIDKIVDYANKQDANVNINAATAAATAQMRFLARDRIVTFIPQVSAKAFTKVAVALAALSGTRVSQSWAEDILESVGRIDKNLPRIGAITSGVGALIGVLLAATSGLLGLGAGLAAIVPTLLIIPGLIIGMGFSITTLVVAMKTAKTELDPLADSMNELADIIQTSYWDAARDPIISLITTLMPQLRVAFAETSASMGRFTAAFAQAFENELSEGRLVPLFDGISKSFDILSTGTEAFAGALVSLSAVAAKYVPRLAQWFVDISITFDTWLSGVANDGRLDGWIERGIVAIKDLGRVVNGVSRQFAALWKAAESGGSGGLTGFADAMQRYADIMESSKFQSTMTAIFEGASDGTKSLADGLVALGDMFYVMQDSLSLFLATTGAIVGQFVADFAGAFSQPEVAQGLADFILGVEEGFASFGRFIPEIALGVAALGSFAGALAEQLGPVLGAVLGALATLLTPLLTFLTEEILPAMVDFSEIIIGLADWIAANAGWVIPLIAGVIAWNGIMVVSNGIMAITRGIIAGYSAATYGAVGATYAIGTAQKIGAIVSGISTSAWGLNTKAVLTNSALTNISKGRILAHNVVVGIATGLQWAWNAAMAANPVGLVVAIILAIIAAIVLLVIGIVKLVQNWDVVVKFLQDVVGNVFSWLGDVFTWLGELFTNIYETAIRPVIEGIGAVFTWLWENVLKPIFTVIDFALALLSAAIQALYDYAVKPALEAIGAMFAWLYEFGIKPVFDQIAAIFAWIYENVIAVAVRNWQGAIGILGDAFAWLYEFGLKPVFDAIGAVFTWLWETIVSPTFDSIGGALETIGAAFETVFGAVGSFVETIFKNIVDFIKIPINAVIDLINGIIGAINNIGIDIPEWAPSSLAGQTIGFKLDKIPKLATGGTIVSRGTVLVGEEGPELLDLNRGASVIPLSRAGNGTGNTIIYNAAPNVSLDAEEALFTAMRRAKVIGW